MSAGGIAVGQAIENLHRAGGVQTANQIVRLRQQADGGPRVAVGLVENRLRLPSPLGDPLEQAEAFDRGDGCGPPGLFAGAEGDAAKQVAAAGRLRRRIGQRPQGNRRRGGVKAVFDQSPGRRCRVGQRAAQAGRQLPRQDLDSPAAPRRQRPVRPFHSPRRQPGQLDRKRTG